jgi:hypothetical protein
MNNELIEQKSWWKKNWKWVVSVGGVFLFLITFSISTGLLGISADIAQAYSDTQLYDKALDQVKSDERVIELLGEIQPIDKLAILEGSVEYSNDNKTVKSSIRLVGTKGRAALDIIADRLDNKWHYRKINLRIKKPIENKQTIEILSN